MESLQHSDDLGTEVASQFHTILFKAQLHLDPKLFSNPDDPFSESCILEHFPGAEDSCR